MIQKPEHPGRFVRIPPWAFIALCTIAAYSTSFFGVFQFDDFQDIVRNDAVHSFSAWGASLGHGLRPLLKLSYTANWVSGLGLPGFHTVNLLLHLVNVFLVFFLFRLILKGDGAKHGIIVPGAVFVAALLFAVHPVQTEAVTYITGRSVTLMSGFYLGALACYVYGTRYQKPVLAFVCAPLLYLCAILARESAILFPVALLLWDLCFEKPTVKSLVRRQWIFWLVFAASGCAAVMHTGYFNLLYGITGARPLVHSFACQLHGAYYLISRLFLAGRLSIDPGLGFNPPVGLLPVLEITATAIMTIIMLIPAAVHRVALLIRVPEGVIRFGFFWFLMHTLLPYTFLPRADIISEHHMYVAGFGLFLVAGMMLSAITSVIRSAWLRGGIVVIVAGACIGVTALRNLDYQSETTLWERTVVTTPDNPRAHNNLGIVYENTRRLDEAIREYQIAATMRPDYEQAVRNYRKLEAFKQQMVR